MTRFRDDLNGGTQDAIHYFAYNRTGKTVRRLDGVQRISGSERTTITLDTLYFNAFTEDLFVWENDLDSDTARHFQINEHSNFFEGIAGLALEETIAEKYLTRYTDFDFDIDYTKWTESFFREG